ncbi:APH(3') family aminoglycoside O-phosphotransferase [Arthrobacter sp. SAFR-044]|uniref:APH(3') family aminoglycoside O-phosphotransferase n=1 Tax=Arthrobacter sp. SAFR-044 TaxID=3387278 RepID=UPI003F7C4DE4
MEEQVKTLRRQYSGHGWTPISIGCSGALVYRLDGATDLYVKVGGLTNKHDAGYDLGAEAERLRWLAKVGIPTPEVVEYDVSDDCAWLVTTAIAGRSAAEHWPADQRTNVIDALADFTRTLHDLPIEDCPYERNLAVIMPAAEHAVRQHLVDLDRLDPAYVDWTPQQLLDELFATVPTSEDLVVCHGDLCLPNVLLDPDTLTITGLVDVGRLGRADRYSDLALVTRSITSAQNPQYGLHHADRYLTRYGIEQADTNRLTFYRLLDQFF